MRAIWPAPDASAVEIIDQTRLPHALVAARLETREVAARAIADMQVRGAAWGFAPAMREDASDARLRRAAARLALTRPTAVNLFWEIDRCVAALGRAAAGARPLVAAAPAREICEEDVANNAAIGEHGLALLREIAARKPAGERLESLTHYNAGGHLMQQGRVDLCLVGTGRSAANGDVCNKIGAYLKALAAADTGVPFYVAAPSPSIDLALAAGRDVVIEDRGADEVTHAPGCDDDGRQIRARLSPVGAKAANPAFDVTPARLVTGLLTERGVIAPHRDAIAAMFARPPARGLGLKKRFDCGSTFCRPGSAGRSRPMANAAIGFDREGSSALRHGRSTLRAQAGGGATLVRPFFDLGYVAHEDWAWENYKPLVLAYAEDLRRDRAARGLSGPVRLLEVGGGRDPLITLEEATAAGLDITINDIDAHELALAPPGYGRAQFDIAGDLAAVAPGAYDLIFSRMVFEHVADVARAWGNCHLLLARGGVALAFHPTLYAPPFLINRLIPENLSSRILRVFFPDRHEGVQPKFPALYDWCYGDVGKVRAMFDAIGFADRLVAPFWSHGYFRAIPGLREIDAAIQNIARKRDWRSLTTYAYTVARK